jgi:lysophospholipase L1-like esterase
MRFVYSLLLALSLVAAPAEARPRVLCTIGDSLVAGGPILGANPSWTQLLQTSRIGERFGVINVGVGGYTAAQIKAVWEAEYNGRGCTHAVVLVGTNNLSAGTSAASTFTDIESLVASIRADGSGDPNGINVTVLTVPPRGGSASWDGTKETQRLALNALILAMGADANVSLESMAGSGNPVEMAAAYRTSDLLHFNGTPTTGGSQEVTDLIDAAVSW